MRQSQFYVLLAYMNIILASVGNKELGVSLAVLFLLMGVLALIFEIKDNS